MNDNKNHASKCCKDQETNIIFESHNMNYIYNVAYFDWILKTQDTEKLAQAANCQIHNFKFPSIDMFKEFRENETMGYQSFTLFTAYPGLLMGIGNLHDIGIKGAYKLGFSFDYVNGLPYLPGSSLKGILRSVFPGQRKDDKEEYKDYLLGLMAELNITGAQKENLDDLESEIFDFHDVFLGAYPDLEQMEDRQFLDTEFVTPHVRLKNPIPISFVKVKPMVKFRFHFLLKDGKILSAENKLTLFKALILELGVGAKTNVGFGRFTASEQKERINNEPGLNPSRYPQNNNWKKK